MRFSILSEEVAARRGVGVSSANSDITCPTATNSTIESKAKNDALSNSRSPEIFPDYFAPTHARMCRMLGYCLSLETPDAWNGFSFVASLRLTLNERAALAVAALNSLEPDEAEMTAAAVVGSAGAPLPPFLGGMDEARIWASYANRAELKAYTLAAFEAMPAKDQAAFLAYAMGAKAA